MNDIKSLFNPLTKIFKFFVIDYDGRLMRETELDLYESKLNYVKAIQQKQYWDSILKYNEARVKTLENLVKIQKGTNNVQTDSITTTTVHASVA